MKAKAESGTIYLVTEANIQLALVTKVASEYLQNTMVKKLMG